MEMIENSLASRMEGKIALKRKSVVLSLVLLVLGIAIIVVSAIIPALESGFMHSLLIFIGGVAAIIGLLLLLSAAFTKQYYYLPENSRLHKKIEYFDLTEESAINCGTTVTSIQAAVEQFLAMTEEQKTAMRSAGCAIARQYSWEACASKIQQAWDEVLDTEEQYANGTLGSDN